MTNRTGILAVATAVTGCLLLAAPAHAGEATVTLSDGRILEQVTLKPGAAPNQVVLERAGETPLTLPNQELLVVDFNKVSGRPIPPTVRLSNGDQVFGKITFPTARHVKIAAGWGALTVPLARCAAIRLNEKAPLPAPVSKDTLILATDRVEGEIQGVSGGKINIDLAGKSVAVDEARVLGMALVPRPLPPPANPGLQLLVDLGGGERLSGRWVKMDADVLTLGMDWGENVDVPIASISSLEVKNGKVVYVSDLKPAEVKEVPYLDGAFPFHADRSVAGHPLHLAGKPYRRGLGVHSHSEITYSLDGGFATFAAMLGVDDEVSGQGSVIFRVFGDDKPLYESTVVHGGDIPQEIKIPVKGVLLLRLVVDYADNGDVADHADWADARLLRP